MSSPPLFELPLFPLQTVLFPDGLLNLKVFEARYLDLIGSCMRSSAPFGVVALKLGAEVRKASDSVAFESIGTMAELIDVDSAQAGILQVRCRGMRRFEVKSSHQQADGLWIAQASSLPDDESVAPAETMQETVKGLANAIATLKAQGSVPFLQPFRFEQAGWVANRWCEILPISLAAKQKLMELPDAMVRLQLVDEFLRSKGVVT
ncbi:LON peptidase substrate-binding domain-containing protein [Piscinibacter sp.]|jgi:Lon protease-like protein|uniref:LON peptidase substrate-binding domain-containing protein n=1 Tax=Piscinibacter sp. TaxID=1903157 RepID=UPI0035594822